MIKRNVIRILVNIFILFYFIDSYTLAHSSCFSYYDFSNNKNYFVSRLNTAFSVIDSNLNNSNIHPATLSEMILEETSLVLGEANKIIENTMMLSSTDEPPILVKLLSANEEINSKIEKIREFSEKFDHLFLGIGKNALAKKTAVLIREVKHIQLNSVQFIDPIKQEILRLSNLKSAIIYSEINLDNEIQYVSLIQERLSKYPPNELLQFIMNKQILLYGAKTLLLGKISELNSRIANYHHLVEESLTLNTLNMHLILDTAPKLAALVAPLLGFQYNSPSNTVTSPQLGNQEKEKLYRQRNGLASEESNQIKMSLLINSLKSQPSLANKNLLLKQFVDTHFESLGIYNLIELNKLTPDGDTIEYMTNKILKLLSTRTTLGAILDLTQSNLRSNLKHEIIRNYAFIFKSSLTVRELNSLSNVATDSNTKEYILGLIKQK